MKYFILKDRRWEGPYSKSELKALLLKSEIESYDYLLSEEDKIKNPLAYKTIHEVLSDIPQKEIKVKEKSKRSPLSFQSKAELEEKFSDALEAQELVQSSIDTSLKSEQANINEDQQEIILEAENTASRMPNFKKLIMPAVFGVFFLVFIGVGLTVLKQLPGPQGEKTISSTSASSDQNQKQAFQSNKTKKSIIRKPAIVEKKPAISLPVVKSRPLEEIRSRGAEIEDEFSAQEERQDRVEKRREDRRKALEARRKRSRSPAAIKRRGSELYPNEENEGLDEDEGEDDSYEDSRYDDDDDDFDEDDDDDDKNEDDDDDDYYEDDEELDEDY